MVNPSTRLVARACDRPHSGHRLGPAEQRSHDGAAHKSIGASWAQDVVRPNSDPIELFPTLKAFVAREERERLAVNLMRWDVLGGAAAWPMTNVRNRPPTMEKTGGAAAQPVSRASHRALRVDTRQAQGWRGRANQGRDVVRRAGAAGVRPPQAFGNGRPRAAGFTMVTCDPSSSHRFTPRRCSRSCMKRTGTAGCAAATTTSSRFSSLTLQTG